MKAELENQKKHNIQLSTSLHKQSKRKSRIMSSSYKVNPNLNNALFPSFLFRITHFSHYFPRNKISKRTKTEVDDGNILANKIREEFDDYKKTYEKNENSYISQINTLNKKIEELEKDKEILEEKIKEIKMSKNKEIEREKQNKHRLLYEEKEKHKKEIEKYNKELDTLKKEVDIIKKENEILKEENITIKKENESNINLKKTLEELKEKEKNYEKIINELKLENEKLLKQTTLNFKLIQEENDELNKDIKKLNETIKELKTKEKEFIEKEKEKKEKEEQQKEKSLDKKYSNNNLKVMRIFSNKFIFKNNNTSEIILKLKETEKKYNELKKAKEKENIALNNQNNILITKEIKSIKDKYEKEMKELQEKNITLNNQIKTINIKKISSNVITKEELKKVVTEISEHFKKIMTNTQSRYEYRILSMKQKLIKIRNTLNKYIKNKNKEKEGEIVVELKEEISKIEKEKQKMKVQISNYDINFQKQNNEITKLKNELSEANKKLNKLNNEVRWNHNDKYELNDMNKKLKKQLEMYIIENNGKSKVIEERNNEISKLKEILNQKSNK